MRVEEQYCNYCGEELDIWKRRSSADKYIDFVYLRCSADKWWKFWEWGKHRFVLIDQETSETILNYDPITGERIKRDAKRVS